ncbi:BnaCnng75180D, partial [Brassica napus]
MKKSKLSQTTVRRRARSSGQELQERPPAKQQRYPALCPLHQNRQCSERCTHENLKHWISQRFEGMENNIEELRTLICKSLGLPEGSKRNARKRKAMDDPQVRRTPFPDDSIVGETEGRNRKGKKRKTVGTRHVGKKTLPRRRS